MSNKHFHPEDFLPREREDLEIEPECCPGCGSTDIIQVFRSGEEYACLKCYISFQPSINRGVDYSRIICRKED